MRHNLAMTVVMYAATLLLIAFMIFRPDFRPVSGTEACRATLEAVDGYKDPEAARETRYDFSHTCQPAGD